MFPNRIFSVRLFFCGTLPSLVCLSALAMMCVIFQTQNSFAAQMTLQWDDSNEHELVSGYYAYCGTSTGNYQITRDVGRQTSCTFSDLREGVVYHSAVKAYSTSTGVLSQYSEELVYLAPTSIDVITDTDVDGINDDYEITTYYTEPELLNTDHDGVNDGEELTFWGNDWNREDVKETLLNIILLFLYRTVWSGTYYVSTSGDDRNFGTANSPWQHCPGMEGWNGGEVSLKPGDVVYFKNDETWTLSGGSTGLSATGGVLYDGETWGNGHRAKFQVTGSYSVAALFIGSDDPTMATEIKGFELDCNRQNTSGANINWPTSRILTGAAKRFTNIEIYGIVGSGEAKYGAKVGATSGNTTKNVEYINMNIHDLNTTAIAIYSAVNCPSCLIDGVLVRGSTIGPNINAGAFDGAGTGIVSKNNVHNAVIEYNRVTDAVGNNILIQDDGSGTAQEMDVRYNIIYRANGSHGITMQSQSTMRGIRIYGNVIYGNPKAALRSESNNTGTNHDVRIYNNTTYHNGSSEFDELSISTAGSFSTLEVINNVLIPSAGRAAIGDPSNKIRKRSNNVSSSSGFKNTSNLPTDFIGTYGVDMAPNNDGLSILQGGYAVDYGLNLGSPYNGSINSVARTDAWDAGAYEIGESGSVITLRPPVNLRVAHQ